jgi:hypothetical protein
LKFAKETFFVLGILMISSPLALVGSYGSTVDLGSTYGLVLVPEFSPSNPITTGSNVWIVIWTANLQTGGVRIVITTPNGSQFGDTLGVSPCTIPLHSETNGLCAIDEISSLVQGTYGVAVYAENNFESLEGDIYRTFKVSQGNPVNTPEPRIPLDVNEGGRFAFGLKNPQAPKVPSNKMNITAWTSNLLPGYVVFSVKAPGGSAVNTTILTSTCTIPQKHRTSGLCAQIRIGPLVSGVYIIETGFYASGRPQQMASIFEEIDVA